MWLAASVIAQPSSIDHAPWDQLLRRYVADGRVDYAGFNANRQVLEQYLTSLQHDPRALSREAQMAFWINAYNAVVIKAVLDHEPVASVKDIKGFFDRLRYAVGGDSLTLNEIEAKARAFGDWRVHIAVVCASTSCPPLRSEAYVPERLEEQLADQTHRFLHNPQWGQRLEGSTWWVSKIFKWYAADFVNGPVTAKSLLPVVAPYLEPSGVTQISQTARSLKFLDYDWSLNRQL